MRANRIIRLFSMTLALMLLLSSPALAASCALCGGETGSDDYLCTDCLIALLNTEPEAAPLEITSCVQNENGTVTITWADEGNNGPYTVYYELLESAPIPFGWTEAEGLNDRTHTLTRLAPGVSYIITVKDSLGQTAEVTYFAPTPGVDHSIGARIRFKPMRRTGRLSKQQTSLSASDMAEENEALHGLYLRLTYSTLARTRYYAFQFVIKAPNGFSDVIYSGNMELHHGESTIPPWGFIPVDDYFDLLQNYYGGIPLGEYDVSLYFDGNEVWTVPLSVTE